MRALLLSATIGVVGLLLFDPVRAAWADSPRYASGSTIVLRGYYPATYYPAATPAPSYYVSSGETLPAPAASNHAPAGPGFYYRSYFPASLNSTNAVYYPLNFTFNPNVPPYFSGPRAFVPPYVPPYNYSVPPYWSRFHP
jgi:hypothetical protein